MGVQIRIDVINDDRTRADIDSFISQYKPTVYVAVREDSGDNPHYHVYVNVEANPKEIGKIRAWWKYREYVKDALCVKKWDDSPDDMTYFYKGDDVYRTTHSQFEQSEFRKKSVEIAKRLQHKKIKKETPNLVTELVSACDVVGAKTMYEVVKVFLKSRVGLQGLCKFKHGAIVKSAYLKLNEESPEILEYEASAWVQYLA